MRSFILLLLIWLASTSWSEEMGMEDPYHRIDDCRELGENTGLSLHRYRLEDAMDEIFDGLAWSLPAEERQLFDEPSARPLPPMLA